MSTSIIGFQMIFLRANDEGIKLYQRKHFIDASNYLIPFDEDDKYGKCTPMCLQMNDNIYSIFGYEEQIENDYTGYQEISLSEDDEIFCYIEAKVLMSTETLFC